MSRRRKHPLERIYDLCYDLTLDEMDILLRVLTEQRRYRAKYGPAAMTTTRAANHGESEHAQKEGL